jgi:hypothetical protein
MPATAILQNKHTDKAQHHSVLFVGREGKFCGSILCQRVVSHDKEKHMKLSHALVATTKAQLPCD